MDANGRLIPLVEDDQGEGIKDFVDMMKGVPEPLTFLVDEFYNTEEVFEDGEAETDNTSTVD